MVLVPLLVILGSVDSAFAQTLRIEGVQTATANVSQFDKLEISFQVVGSAATDMQWPCSRRSAGLWR
jgi:hypothetical protein